MIREIIETPPVFGEPIIFCYGAWGYVKSNPEYHYPETYVSGSGKAFSRQEAYQKCVAETIEHICAFDLALDGLPLAAWKELKSQAVHPDNLPGYSPSQFQLPNFPCAPFTEETRVRWIKGHSLTNHQEIWVPHQYVKIYRQQLKDEPLIFWANSSGHAAGLTLEQAVLNGIYEVIERDAFSLLWLNQLTLPRVDLEQPPDHTLAVLFKEKFHKIHLKWSVVNMTTDLSVPAFLVVLRQNHGKGPLLCLSACSGLDSSQAVQHALLEAAACRNYLISLQGKLQKEILNCQIEEAFKRVHNFEDHMALSMREDYLPFASFIDSSSSILDLNSLPNLSSGNISQDLEQCVSLLKGKGYEVIYVEITNEEAVRYGLKVVKVIIPGLQPLHSGYLMEPLKNRRLYEYPRKMGYVSSEGNEKNLYRIPHPFS